MPHRTRRISAYSAYLTLEGALSLFSTLVFTLAAVYRVQVAGLNPLQLVLVGTVMECSIFVFQLPTGVIADVFSRRLSIIVGVIIMGAGIVLEGLVPRFGVILLAQAIWGLGYTFSSGATEAWIADEVGPDLVGNTYMRGAQIGQITRPLGILAVVTLGSLRLNVPYLAGGTLMMALGLLLVLIMPERPHHHAQPGGGRASWRELGATMGQGLSLVRTRPALLAILGVGLFLGLYSEGYDRLSDAHFLKDLTFPPLGHLSYVVWFGIFDMGGTLLSLVATEVVRRRVDLASARAVARALVGMTGLLSASVIAFGLAPTFGLAVACVWAIAVLRSTIDPLYTAWLAQHTDSSVRATVISIAGQVDA
ncbi:MAG TPA: MFS transporter, partial [Ktedonobacterales bacterium]|nr:MFS transporter [Ktedonobacterales bacterium]